MTKQSERKILKFVGKLGLPTKTEELAKLVQNNDFPRLVTALVRCRLAKNFKDVLPAAQES
jgi:hypothetical protein